MVSSSSHPRSDPVNAEPRRDDSRHRADISAPNYRLIARRLRRRVLDAERRARGEGPVRRRDPAPGLDDRRRGEAGPILDALARSYAPGDRVTVAEVAAAAGCPEYVAVRVRKWARSVELWPYRPGIGFIAALRKKGGAT